MLTHVTDRDYLTTFATDVYQYHSFSFDIESIVEPSSLKGTLLRYVSGTLCANSVLQLALPCFNKLDLQRLYVKFNK